MHRPGFDGFQVVFQWLRPLPCLAGVPCTAACLRFRSVGPYSSVHKALDSAWRHIQSVEAHCEALEMEQQDLIGFFNSVPHARILQALELLIWRLEELFRHNVEDIVFQVDMKADTKGLRIFRVQQRFRQSVTRLLRLCHVQELTTFLLRSAYFKVGRDTFCQIQGASMGSPLAPVLCSLVAAEQEFLLIRSFRQQLHAAGLLRAFRYADNRCFFLRQPEMHTDWATMTCSWLSTACLSSLNMCQENSC